MNQPTFPSLDQLRRDAQRLKRERACRLHEAQDAIAQRQGYPNWSRLAKALAQADPSGASFRSVAEMSKALASMLGPFDIDDQVVREKVLDQHFASAEEAVAFALDYVACLLRVPHYEVSGQSVAYFEMRAWLPYRLHPEGEGGYVLVGRDYMPVGVVRRDGTPEHVHRTRAPQLRRVLTEEFILQHSVPRYSNALGYLYDDGPWSSRQACESYFSALSTLQRGLVHAQLLLGPKGQ